MKQSLKYLIKILTPDPIKRIFETDVKKQYEGKYKYLNISFSQEGEDLILCRFFGNRQNGFFVDVGAHHPIRFSNTYKFYLIGWRGINIDAMPGSMKIFKEVRPEDINLEVPISDKDELLTFYIFNEPALNTFSITEATRKDGIDNYKIIEKQELQTQRLDSVLDKYLPQGKNIDFLSIDVEGFDLKVLISNNWVKYKPDFVLVEDLQGDIEKVFDTELYIFMRLNGYRLVARTFNTLFFRLA